MGSLVDVRQIDEVHVFIAPKLVGGAFAEGPVGRDSPRYPRPSRWKRPK